jgi:hypothetical protein
VDSRTAAEVTRAHPTHSDLRLVSSASSRGRLASVALRIEQDTLAEEIEAGSAEHLTFEHLDPVDVSFDHAGAPGQGEAGDDGVPVAVDAGGERVEAGEVVSPDGIKPLRQPFALALGEHLTEGADVAGDGVRFRAVDQNGLEPELLRLGEALRPTEDPSGDDPG